MQQIVDMYYGFRVLHQIKYLGLRENIRVKRAGFAYRRAFEKFVRRYGIILQARPLPKNEMSYKKACFSICQSVQLAPSEFQLGRTKIFIKSPESLIALEEARERKYDIYARILQKAFRQFANKNCLTKQMARFSHYLPFLNVYLHTICVCKL